MGEEKSIIADDISGTDQEYDLVGPRADVLMESLRATGYSLPDAIADLIDNSLTAGARNIWLNFDWAGHDSTISLLDDGLGMSCAVLINAMRLGSQNPLNTRDGTDLGRYGLGLKTASISQARSLTVASRVSRTSETSVRRWDLDYVASVRDWHLLKSASPRGNARLSVLDEMPHGTIVLWEKIDRLVGESDASDARARRHFLEAAKAVELHIAMVFHRFMSGPRAVAFWINSQRVTPWDPFLSDHDATQRLPAESLGTFEERVIVEPYILPHHSRLSAEQHSVAGGPAGWNSHQGFYVYRNRRLLLAGDWLGLGYRKEEHYKLARILVDLSSSMDYEWDIDVRKSRARPPVALRDELRRVARLTRDRAVTVYRHRGKILARSVQASPIFVWQRRVRSQRVSYVINREHPLIKDALQADAIDSAVLRRVFRLIEEYVPIQQIWVDAAEGDATQSQPFGSAPSEELVEMIQMLYRAFRVSGLSHIEALGRLRSTEGFGDRYELIELAIKGAWAEAID
jgi:hypothetical protein